MSASSPGPENDLIEYAAGIIVESRKQPFTAPAHWAGALYEAGMLVAPGAAHAAPARVEITDEAVDKAADVLMDHGHNGIGCQPEPGLGKHVREALEAAVPFLQPQPAREDCTLCQGLGGIALHEKWSAARGKPLWTAHEHPSEDPHPTQPCPSCSQPQPVGRPLLDREAATRAIQTVYGGSLDVRRGSGAQQAADAVMELARPMPTREQIEKAIAKATGHTSEWDQHEEGEMEEGCASCAGWGYPCATLREATDMVAALLGGVDESACTLSPDCPWTRPHYHRGDDETVFTDSGSVLNEETGVMRMRADESEAGS